MSMKYLFAGFSIAFACLVGFSTPSIAATQARLSPSNAAHLTQMGQGGDAAIAEIRHMVQQKAAFTGLKLTKLSVKPEISFAMGNGTLLAAAGSQHCTVTATVTVPGVASTTFSATASTCAKAAEMVMNGVSAWLKSLGKMIPHM